MKMAFLVICPGSFQYDGERETEVWTWEEKDCRGGAEEEGWGEENKTSQKRTGRGAFLDLRKRRAAPLRAHYHS